MVVLNRLVAAKPWIHVLQMCCLFQLHVAKHVHSFDDVDIGILPSLIVPGTWMIDRLF